MGEEVKAIPLRSEVVLVARALQGAGAPPAALNAYALGVMHALGAPDNWMIDYEAGAIRPKEAK